MPIPPRDNCNCGGQQDCCPSIAIVDTDGDELNINSDGSIDVNTTVMFPPSIDVVVTNTPLDVTLDEPIDVTGTVSVSNFPASVEISNDVGNPIPVNGTVCIDDCGGSLTVDGSVDVSGSSISVSNFPSSVEISNDAGNPIPVNGTVCVDDCGGSITVDTNDGPIDVTGSVTLDNASVTISSSTDILGNLITGSRYNQTEVQFHEAAPSSLVTVTTASGGTATQLNGVAVFATSANVNGRASGVTTSTTRYRPDHEIYAAFTAAFTAPTSAASYQRIGLYDASNGFFIGYEGTSFGVTHRRAGIDSSIAQASFNVDTLTGAVGSKFTLNGSPVALDHTKLNLYHIDFSWFGASPIRFRVLSPDGDWVVFHEIHYPNSSAQASIVTPTLPVTLDIRKTASDATNLQITTGCWAAGSTSDLDKVTATITDDTLAKNVRAVITGHTTAGGGDYVNVKVNPSGSLVVDPGTVTVTGTVAVSSIPEVEIKNDTGNPIPVSGTVTVNQPVAVTDNSGSLTVDELPASSAAISRLASSLSSQQLLAANTSRRGAIFYNDSTSVAYVKFGTTASTTSFTYRMAGGDTLELPSPIYTGRIDVIWTVLAVGAMQATEIT